MKKLYFIISLIFMLSSCNQEVVVIKGELKGYTGASVELKLKTITGEEKMISTNIAVDAEKFQVDISEIKPPYKLTLVLSDKKEVSYWVFRYGKFNFELNTENIADFKINDSFENDELIRVNETYNKMYLKPLKKQIDWLANYESTEHEVTNEADEEKLERYKIQIKKAYRLRKKTILKTVRKAPQNPIAMALFYDEFKSLTKWQKEECFKYAKRYYSDTGMNWQLKH